MDPRHFSHDLRLTFRSISYIQELTSKSRNITIPHITERIPEQSGMISRLIDHIQQQLASQEELSLRFAAVLLAVLDDPLVEESLQHFLLLMNVMQKSGKRLEEFAIACLEHIVASLCDLRQDSECITVIEKLDVYHWNIGQSLRYEVLQVL